MAMALDEKEIKAAQNGDKFDRAKELKTEGNDLFKQKELRRAIGKYHRSILYLKGMGVVECGAGNALTSLLPQSDAKSLSEAVKQEAKILAATCYCNLAACMLQQKEPNYEKILQHCDASLELNETTKALYRKGVALYHLKDVEKAEKFLKEAQAKTVGQKDPAIQKYIGMCQAVTRVQDEKLKEACKQMFASTSKIQMGT